MRTECTLLRGRVRQLRLRLVRGYSIIPKLSDLLRSSGMDTCHAFREAAKLLRFRVPGRVQLPLQTCIQLLILYVLLCALTLFLQLDFQNGYIYCQIEASISGNNTIFYRQTQFMTKNVGLQRLLSTHKFFCCCCILFLFLFSDLVDLFLKEKKYFLGSLLSFGCPVWTFVDLRSFLMNTCLYFALKRC